MQGWERKNGEISTMQVSEDKMWSLFNFVFSESCQKRNTYKFGLVKAILDNLFNMKEVDELLYISFYDLFAKFAENYWNLVVKYGLKQMRPDGKSIYSFVEKEFMAAVLEEPALALLEFDALVAEKKATLINHISQNCRKNVVGALYTNFEGCLYAFDLKGKGLYFSHCAYEFMLRYKVELEKLNYYAWAKFLEKINDDGVLVRVIDKLELSTPHRNDLSMYREILRKEFEQCNCFYCGKRLGTSIHVDHFIPWSYIKDDKIWNFVLSCPSCNERKNDRIPSEIYLHRIQMRNRRIITRNIPEIEIDFVGYSADRLERIWKYAQLSGLKQFSK